MPWIPKRLLPWPGLCWHLSCSGCLSGTCRARTCADHAWLGGRVRRGPPGLRNSGHLQLLHGCQAQGIFAWREDRLGQSDKFSWFVVRMSLVSFWVARRVTGTKIVYMSHCDFSEGYIKSSIFGLQGFRKKVSFSSQWFQVKMMGKILETLVWRVVARHWRKLEFRI